MTAGGGAWDNAKKLIEDGAFGGKGSEAHAAVGHRRHGRRPVQGHRRPGDQPDDQGREHRRDPDHPADHLSSDGETRVALTASGSAPRPLGDGRYSPRVGASVPAFCRAQSSDAYMTPRRWPNADSTASQRVLGVNALFSTAYGNVGCSIYYALGLVACLRARPDAGRLRHHRRHLLSAPPPPTPRRRRCIPEAGGSSSFARHAFNEFWSFFAAWGQMLNYIITIAISAFFVPHYLGGLLLGRRCATRPATSSSASAWSSRARRRSTSSASRSRPGSTSSLAVVDFMTQVLLVIVGAGPRLLAPRRWSTTCTSASRRRGSDFLIAIPIGDDRLHRHRDDLEHGRGGARRGEDDPGGDQPRRDRRLRDLRRCCPPSRSRRCRSRSDATAVPDAARPHRGPGRLRGRPDARRRQAAATSARSSTSGEIYVGILAATILFIATNAGIIGVSRLVYSMGMHRQMPDRLRQLHPQLPHAVDRDPRLRRHRLRHADPGPGRVPGQHVRVRRDAVVHDRARGGDPRCGWPSPTRARPYRGPGNLRIAGSDIAAVRGRRRHRAPGIAFVTVTVLHVDVAIAGIGWLLVGVAGLRRSTAAARGST